MKNIPITKFEAYLRVIIAYIPFVVPPLYYEDDRAWVFPMIYFCTLLWGIPFIAFTDEREQTDAATQIMGKGMLPLGYLMLWGMGLSAVLFVFFGTPMR